MFEFVYNLKEEGLFPYKDVDVLKPFMEMPHTTFRI